MKEDPKAIIRPKDCSEELWVKEMKEKGIDYPRTDLINKLGLSTFFIHKYIRKEVTHSFYSLNPKEKKNYLGSQGSLYFSRDELRSWFKRNCVITRQTQLINLSDYSDLKKDTKEMKENINKNHQTRIKREYLAKFGFDYDKIYLEESCYSEKFGKFSFSVIDYTKRTLLPEEKIDIDLLDLETYGLQISKALELVKDRQPEKCYRYAYQHGLIKVKIGYKKTLFLVPKDSKKIKTGVYVLVPASYKIPEDILLKDN